MTQSKQRAQHVGRHIPREPVLAVGRERLAGKGAGVRVPTLKGSLAPLLLESSSVSPVPSWHIPCRGKAQPQGSRVGGATGF